MASSCLERRPEATRASTRPASCSRDGAPVTIVGGGEHRSADVCERHRKAFLGVSS